MPVYSLRTVQKIPVSLEKAWDFFSHPANLAELTPAYLNLKFTNQLFGEEMYPGQVITYNVKPLLGIPMFWMTEITHVDHHRYFVDEQRTGPYRIWHHQHHFRSIDGGVDMTDIVHYQPPLGWLGGIANTLLIRKQLSEIFDYRFRRVEELFGKWNG
jgi:ligand-binding SRPBCC domain-containing protein